MKMKIKIHGREIDLDLWIEDMDDKDMVRNVDIVTFRDYTPKVLVKTVVKQAREGKE